MRVPAWSTPWPPPPGWPGWGPGRWSPRSLPIRTAQARQPDHLYNMIHRV